MWHADIDMLHPNISWYYNINTMLDHTIVVVYFHNNYYSNIDIIMQYPSII